MSAIFFSTNGYICSVLMTIFEVESSRAPASWVESSSIFLTTPGVWSNWKMVFWSCRSRTTRSVITMILLKTGWLAVSKSVERRCASHAIVFDLPEPAECWTK